MTDDKLDLPQGTLDLLILKALSLEPQHGWAISERIHQVSRATLQIPQGSLYPALHRLERRGWIKRRVGRVGQQSQSQVLRAHARRPQSSSTPKTDALAEAHRRGVARPRWTDAARGWSTDAHRILERPALSPSRARSGAPTSSASSSDELRFHVEREAEKLRAAGHAARRSAFAPRTTRVRRRRSNQGRYARRARRDVRRARAQDIATRCAACARARCSPPSSSRRSDSASA